MTADPDEVLIRVDGSVGLMTLNRPKAINSLTHNMVNLIDRALTQWARRPRHHGRGALRCRRARSVRRRRPRRALSQRPGRTVPTPGSSGSTSTALNAKIGSYPKPYVALMDGIVMGGGVGVVRARQRPRGHRDLQDRDARGRHRLHPRRRRHLSAVACTGTARPARRADRRTVLRGRRHRDGLRRPFRPARRARGVHRRRRRRRRGSRRRAPTRRSHRRVSFWPSGTGSTSATRARPSPTSSRRCAATTQVRPTTRPT